MGAANTHGREAAQPRLGMGCVQSLDTYTAAAPVGTAEGLSPFYGAADASASLTSVELEACLNTIGMRKSVLALARDSYEGKRTITLTAWWDALNPRSRIVITSKIKSIRGTSQVPMLRIACALAVKSSGGRMHACESKAEVAAALSAAGVDDGEESDQLQAMVATIEEGVRVDLGAWLENLSPTALALLLNLFLDQQPAEC